MRVVAGRFGGRTLVAPSGADTRPTADRVREALFSILGELDGAVVLDLYAGTGALGIEALSRGAAHATFVEKARSALQALRHNIDALQLAEATTVVPISVERALTAASWGPAAFDLIFLDPPYAEVKGNRAALLSSKLAGGLESALRPGGRVVFEHASVDDAPNFPALELADTRVYGDTALSFYLR